MRGDGGVGSDNGLSLVVDTRLRIGRFNQKSGSGHTPGRGVGIGEGEGVAKVQAKIRSYLVFEGNVSRLHVGVVVVRFNFFQLEINPVVLDQRSNNTSACFTHRLLLRVEWTRHGILGILDSILGLSDRLVCVCRNSCSSGLSLVLDILTSRRGRVPIDSLVQVCTSGGCTFVDKALGLVGCAFDSILGSAEVFVGVGGCSRGSFVDVAFGLSSCVFGSVLGPVSVLVSVSRGGSSRGWIESCL